MANTSLDDGIAFYNEHHYQLAKRYLESCTISDPSNPAAHYYLANTLALLQEHELARQQYQICRALEPRGPYARYAKEALDRYGQASNIGTAITSISSATATETSPYSQSLGGYTPYDASRLTAHPGYSIGVGVDPRRAYNARSWNTGLNPRYPSSNSPRWYDPRNYVPDLSHVPGSEEHRLRLKQSINQTAQQIDSHMLGEHNEDSADEVMELARIQANLNQQLLHPIPTGPRLKASGTDLYTRNYDYPSANPSPSAKPQTANELIAAPDRLILDRNTSPSAKQPASGTPEGLRATQDSLILEKRSVHGRVLEE